MRLKKPILVTLHIGCVILVGQDFAAPTDPVGIDMLPLLGPAVWTKRRATPTRNPSGAPHVRGNLRGS